MKDFNEILKNKLYDYQEAPPREVFDIIRKNYPKRTFWDVIMSNKIYFIASLIITSFTLFLLLSQDNLQNNNSNAESVNFEQVIYNDIDKVEHINNIKDDKQICDNKDKKEVETIINRNETHQSGVNKKNIKEILRINVFDIKDTVICGNIYVNNCISKVANIVLPKEIKLIEANNNISLICSKPGNYLIKYYEDQGNKVLVDSMRLEYNEVKNPEILLSSDVLCYDEKLSITIDNEGNSDLKWGIYEENVKSIGKGKYEISGLKPGTHNIVMNFQIDGCMLKKENQIKVRNNFEHNLIISPNYCSGLNAKVVVKSKNYNPEFYILDNNYVNRTGRFENLNSGIHTLKIAYGNNCYFYDTIFIADSMNLNPYFKSERDLVDKNKYNFRNFTKIDNLGFEQDPNIEFVWKVDGLEFSRADNPYYEFNTIGKHTIELTVVRNMNCSVTYSENIIISDYDFKIPNVFTPNGDGVSDYFEISYERELSRYHIIITSVQGEKVFESENINKSWDGKIFGNNDAIDGHYYYVINAEDIYGNKLDQTGIIQLIRR